MIPTPSDVRLWLAVGRTDMRRGMNGLALQVQEALQRIGAFALSTASHFFCRLRPTPVRLGPAAVAHNPNRQNYRGCPEVC